MSKERFLDWLEDAVRYAVEHMLAEPPAMYFSEACMIELRAKEGLSYDELVNTDVPRSLFSRFTTWLIQVPFIIITLVTGAHIREENDCALKGFVYGEYGFRFCPHRDTYVGKEDFRGGKAIVLRAQDFKTIFGRGFSHPVLYVWQLKAFCGHDEAMVTANDGSASPNNYKWSMTGRTYGICDGAGYEFPQSYELEREPFVVNKWYELGGIEITIGKTVRLCKKVESRAWHLCPIAEPIVEECYYGYV